MVKIIGAYRVAVKVHGSTKYVKEDVVVMENLFYERKMARAFDLKGSIRNRYQHMEEAVMLDENLLECKHLLLILL